MGVSTKIENFLKHSIWDTIATFIKKFKSSKSYWSVSFFVIAFTLREAIAWKYGSAISTYAQKQLEGSDWTWLWTAIEFVFDMGGSWELVLLGVFYFIILSFVKVNSAEKDEIVKTVKEESKQTHDSLDEIKALIKQHGTSETDFLEKYFGKDYAVILQNPQTYHNFTTFLNRTEKTADELLKEREDLLKKIKKQSFSEKLQNQIDKAFNELRYEDVRELIDGFLDANTDKEQEIIKAHYIKALSYMEQIRYHEAKEEFEKIAPNIDDVEILFDYAEIYFILDEYNKSLELQNRILHILDLNNEANYSILAVVYENIGAIFHKNGKYDKAIEYYTNALNKKIELYGEIHPEVGTSFNNMGLLCHDLGSYEEAIGLYEKSLTIHIETLEENDLRISSTYSNLGMSLSEIGNFIEAKKYYQKSLDIIDSERNIEAAKVYNNLALTLKKEQDYNKAIEFYQKALNLQIIFLGKEHSDVGITYNNIGSVFYAKKEYNEAIEYYMKSLSILENIFSVSHPVINGIKGNLLASKESLNK